MPWLNYSERYDGGDYSDDAECAKEYVEFSGCHSQINGGKNSSF